MLKLARNKTVPYPVEFYDLHPQADLMLEEVISGLKEPAKSIPPKFFYDERGSRLFSKICQLKEYYIPSVEISLLQEKAQEISEFLQEDFTLVEYGCGGSKKAQLLIESLPHCKSYVAIEISKAPLFELSQNLAHANPHLKVVAICADFMQPMQIPYLQKDTLKKVAFFPGSSIGNFTPVQACDFLLKIVGSVGRGGGLLIGVDLKKNRTRLYWAYNDRRGITAEFNKNILYRLNRDYQSNFEPSQFQHLAFYNEEMGRIEMHLKSLIEQTVLIPDEVFHFAQHETIHTENSYKYTVGEFQDLAFRAGWNPRRAWTDEAQMFSIHYLEAL